MTVVYSFQVLGLLLEKRYDVASPHVESYIFSQVLPKGIVCVTENPDDSAENLSSDADSRHRTSNVVVCLVGVERDGSLADYN